MVSRKKTRTWAMRATLQLYNTYTPARLLICLRASLCQVRAFSTGIDVGLHTLH